MEDYPCDNARLVAELALARHPEGGYYKETDRQAARVPSPFADGALRSLATSIYYLLTWEHNAGVFHMNRSVTYHTLHHGRAEYTLITPGRPPAVARAVLGADHARGERRLLVVGGGVWKASRLLRADVAAAEGAAARARTGCLITEVVTPGFDWADHEYMTEGTLRALFEGAAGGEAHVEEFMPFVKREG